MNFTAFGLTIQSELPLPELPRVPDPHPDVTIRFGKVPSTLPDAIMKYGIWEAARDQFLLKVDGVARYLIRNGRDIKIQREAHNSEKDLRVFLMGSSLAALLHQRQMLILHASAIKTKKGAVLFMGPSGSGKSTLLSAMVNRGYPMLSDDITAITGFENNGIKVLPAFPHVRLWADMVSALHPTASKLNPVRQELDKYYLSVDNFCNKAIPIHCIYLVALNTNNETRIEPIENIDRFRFLHNYTYRKKFLRGLALQDIHFKFIIALAKKIKMSHLARPFRTTLLDELALQVEADI